MRMKEKRRRKEKKRAGKCKKLGPPSLVLAHAIRYCLHDTLARVHDPTFVLARIIPRRDPLHCFVFVFVSTYARAWK